jgi:hypothetical protein
MSRQPKKRIAPWSPGDYFLIPLADGSRGIGQVLNLMMDNIVSIAITDRRIDADSPAGSISVGGEAAPPGDVVSAIATWRDPLDEARWPIVGHGTLLIPREQWPNEEFRARNWVGAKHYNTPLVEEFLSAFHALKPWDAWHDPAYLDKLLISPSKKPAELVYSKR